MSGLMIAGAILVLLGLVGYAIPMFTTQQTKDVANVGPVHVQTTEDTTHVIPPIVSGGAIVLGVVLLGAGFFQRR
jgi:hypothetical protein